PAGISWPGRRYARVYIPARRAIRNKAERNAEMAGTNGPPLPGHYAAGAGINTAPTMPTPAHRAAACTRIKAGGKRYASEPSVPARLSSEAARDISPKQVAVAISDDQKAIQSKAGMTFSSSASWVT